MLYKTAFLSLLVLPIAFISACSTVVDGQTQDITIETPGAENALCTLHTEGNKYKAHSNQTITIQRSRADLLVECKAAGNRDVSVHAKNGLNGWVFANIVNGFVPGATYDYVSRGGFEYPSKVVVNFSGVPVKPYDLPDYHNDDLRHNNDYNNSENMGPSVVEMPAHSGVSTLKKKTLPYGSKAAPSSSVLYPRSNSIVPYDPSEELK